MSNQTILALDLGTQTGWALLKRGEKISSGSKSFKQGKFEGAGMRFLKFRGWLSHMRADADEIHEVYFEAVRRHIGTDAAHMYGGFMACLTAWCEQNNIPYQGVPVGTIKKSGTGKGNAGKDEMIESALKKGFNPVDDNEADAIHLLHYVMKNLG